MVDENNKSKDFLEESSICKFLLNPDIRSIIISEIDDWMFSFISSRAVIKCLLNNIFDGKELEDNYILLYIKQNNPKISDSDYNHIIQCISPRVKITDDNKDYILSSIEKFVKNRLKSKSFEYYASGKESESDKLLERRDNFTIAKDIFKDPSDDKSILKMKEESTPNGKSIKSSIELYNRVSSNGGYSRGDLICIVSPPKTGKTTMMSCETAHFIKNGIKTVYMALGDMIEIDILSKVLSNLTNDPIEVIMNDPSIILEKYPETRELLKNLRVTALPAGEMDVRSIIGHLKNLKKKFDYEAVIIDYDSNIAAPKTDNLYEIGGIIYTALKGFAQKERVVVLVGSQPKISFWEHEILDMSSAAESSRKQHTIDTMITIGKNKDFKYIGSYHIACMRRGEGNITTRVRFEYKNSRIREISQIEYNKSLDDHKRSMLKKSEEKEKFSDPLED